MIFKKLKILFSFHKSDAIHLKQLEQVIPVAKIFFKDIDFFHRSKMCAGDLKEEVFKSHLSQSNMVFVLLSPEHINSDEIDLIKEHARQNPKCLIIPITLRNCVWNLESFFSERLTSPKSEKYLSDYDDKDSFWGDVHNDLIHVFQNIKNRENGSLRIYMNTSVSNFTVRAGGEGNEYSQEPLENFSNYIEIRNVSPNAKMFPIIGDSMTGRFEEGDYVVCEKVFGEDGTIVAENKKTLLAIQQKITAWSKEGKDKKYVCVVETMDNGLFLKYVESINFEKGHFVFSSHNPTYLDMHFDFVDIKALWQVKKVHLIRDVD